MMLRAVLMAMIVALSAGWAAAAGLQATAPVAQLDDEQVRDSVLRANSDGIYSEAYRTSDPDLLRVAWAGEAFLDMQEDIQGLRAMGQYLDLQLEDLQFRRIQELGPGRVRAITLERWLVRLYQTNGVYLGFQRQTVENRYLLDRRDDNWYIIEADQEIQGGDPMLRQGDP